MEQGVEQSVVKGGTSNSYTGRVISSQGKSVNRHRTASLRCVIPRTGCRPRRGLPVGVIGLLRRVVGLLQL